MTSGYVHCACRDCFEIAIADDSDESAALCHACVDAGCTACDCDDPDRGCAHGGCQAETAGVVSETTRAIVAEAIRDAATFAKEFPGELLDPARTDWDSTAWECAPRALQEIGGAWELYDATLVAEVARLARARRGGAS